MHMGRRCHFDKIIVIKQGERLRSLMRKKKTKIWFLLDGKKRE